jgi:hypothetical protein
MPTKTAAPAAKKRTSARPLPVGVGVPVGPINPVVIRPGTLGNLFQQRLTTSPVQAQQWVGELLLANRPMLERAEQTSELVHWAAESAGAVQRQALVRSFREAKAELMLVQHMSELPRERTASFMTDYLAAGGSLGAVMDWLQVVGATLNAKSRSRVAAASKTVARAAGRKTAASKTAAAKTSRGAASRGWFDDAVKWVGDAAKKVGNAIGDVVDSVVNAVISAGKTLAQAVAEAVNWTLDQVKNMVTALLRAGRRVADILAAAVTKGVEELKQYVEAIIAAGRSVAEVMAWAANQVAATVNGVVAKLLQLGRSVLEVVKAVVNMGQAAMLSLVRALIAAGRNLAAIIGAVAAEALSVLQPVIQALLAAGQALANLLAEAARQAVNTCRNIVQALLNLGQTLGQLLADAAAAVLGTLKTIVQALLALGRSLAQVLVAAAALAAAVVKSVLQALMALGQKVADIILAAVGQAVAVAKAIFTALMALGEKLGTFLVTVAGRALSAVRTALEALLSMGIAFNTLVAEICNGVAQAFRRGFFEGLVALGKGLLQILKAAVEVSVSVALLAVAVIFEMCGGYRQLTPNERAEAEKIFGSSVNLDRVQVGFASLPRDIIEAVNGELSRAFTTMYLINFGPGATVDIRTVIHEMAHVWQGVQQGPLYMTQALEAQITAGMSALFHKGKYDDHAAYEVTQQAIAANGGNLNAFNPEQQASIVELYWVKQYGQAWLNAGKPGFPTRPDDGLHTADTLRPYAEKVFKAIARGRGAVAKRGAGKKVVAKTAVKAAAAKKVVAGRGMRRA